MKQFSSILLFVILFFSCNTDSTYLDKPIIKEIPNPSKEGAASNLFVNDSGTAYLSWVEYLNDSTDALMISELLENEFGEAKMVASGTDWFVNWADFPSIVNYKNNEEALAVHWLQKSAGGNYDYDVRIAQSIDKGNSWSSSFIPHRDSIAAEHGFVSMFPLNNGRVFATWLDGRNTKGEEATDSHNHDDHGHGHGGSMTIRSAEFDINGKLYNEAELDNRVCDCCQTTAALTNKGIIVAYRDRTEDEIRDISIVRNLDGEWTQPRTISNDNWKITGCPVNGPSIAANGNHVAITWYTIKEGKPTVNIAFSNDSGKTFADPIQVNEKDPLGRTDLIYINENEVLVSWVEERDTIAEIRGLKMNIKGKTGESFLIQETDPARKSGFPIIKKFGDDVLVTWTEVGESTRIETALIHLTP